MTSYYLVANDAVSFLMYAINNVMTYVIYANSPPITTLNVISGGGIISTVKAMVRGFREFH